MPDGTKVPVPKGVICGYKKGKKNYQAYVVEKCECLEVPEDYDFGPYVSTMSKGTQESFAERFKQSRFQNTFGKKDGIKKSHVIPDLRGHLFLREIVKTIELEHFAVFAFQSAEQQIVFSRFDPAFEIPGTFAGMRPFRVGTADETAGRVFHLGRLEDSFAGTPDKRTLFSLERAVFDAVFRSRAK